MLDFDPTESAGFLVGRVAHALKLCVQEFLDEAEIPLFAEEISILTAIAYLDEPIRMKDLAEKVGREASTLSRQVARLESSGLVQRSPCPQDRRATVVRISKAGRNLVKRTTPMTLALRKRAMQNVSKSDTQALVKSLSQMLENLKDA